MFSGWMHFGPSALAGFLASSVECVEALTIILAVGSTRGWREALCGTAAALALLVALVAVFGEALEQIPLATLQIYVGGLLVVFGMRWLKKSILRYAGIIPLHDEAAAFAAEQCRLGSGSGAPGRDIPALATTFQITMLEGAEVVFIVLGIGAGGPGLTDAASVGAIAALLVTAVVGVIVHRPLANVPENLLKFIVGILLTAFGTFWFGEGAGIVWPGEEASLVGLALGFFVVAVATIRLCRAGRLKAFDTAASEARR
jgi:Ca2+/H+ antiporter, TMEM165/GDT1 family